MSSWSPAAGVRHAPAPHSSGEVKMLRSYRPKPYPPPERNSHHQERYEHVEESDDYSDTVDYETYELSSHQPHDTHQPSADASPDAGDERSAVYERIYQQLHRDEAKRPADCVLLSVNNQNLAYAERLCECLRQRGLAVELLLVRAESGLSRALQDVRSHASPLCILVEQTNVALSSCTLIIFSESLKIHRNMPRERALELATAEFERISGARRRPRDPAVTSARAAEMTDDYLERAKLQRHFLPSDARHLLFLLREGMHLHLHELRSLTDLLHDRLRHLQGASGESDSEASSETPDALQPDALGNPAPALLPNPAAAPAAAEHTAAPAAPAEPTQPRLTAAADTYPISKPPPLLSIKVLQGSPHLRPAPHAAPAHYPPPHPSDPYAPSANSAPHGAPTSHGPPSHPGPYDPYDPHDLSAPYGPHTSSGAQFPRGPPALRGLTASPPPRPALLGPCPPPPHSDYGPQSFPASPPPRGPLLQHPTPRAPNLQNGSSRPCTPRPRGPPPPLLRSPSMGGQAGPRPLLGPMPRPLRRPPP